jgi:uncharacterized membrane protein YphA (DoxX/SURF4 family)
LAAVFLMAAVSKITDLRGFDDQVLLHSDLPRWLGKAASTIGAEPTAGFHLTKLIVAFLPWLELTCGLCLAFGWAVREAALTAGLLLVLFLTYSFASRTDNCQCFFVPSGISSFPWWAHSLRDGAFLLCALVVARGPPKDRQSSRPALNSPRNLSLFSVLFA